MKKSIIFVIAILALFTGYYYFRHPLGTKATINNHVIHLELAITDSEKEKGLGFRDQLDKNSGMLFVYQTKGQYGYWMKGMRFPLDFIWIDGNRIVDLSHNIPAPANDQEHPVELAPRAPVDK